MPVRGHEGATNLSRLMIGLARRQGSGNISARFDNEGARSLDYGHKDH